ncbi:MAG: family 16 glycosylhydrolase [Oscillospiraceae bacterium]|nr:family 16 glycosylhydrolase [Oscillospiraceae bacterium]
MKQFRIRALMLSMAVTACCVTAGMPATAEETSTEVKIVRHFEDGEVSGYFYEYGCQGDTSAMQVSWDGFRHLEASWEDVKSPLACTGFSHIEYNRETPAVYPFSIRGLFEDLEYSGEFRIGFDSVFGVHGWLSDPRAEFFVAEAYLPGARVLPDDSECYCGMMTMENGETYRIYKTEKTGKTPFADSETYLQYWSVRDPDAARSSTNRTFHLKTPLENHFTAWAMLGMELGICEQIDIRLFSDPEAVFAETGYLKILDLDADGYTTSKFTLRNSTGKAITSLRPGDLNTDGRLTRDDLNRYGVILWDFFDKHMTYEEQCAADMNGDMKIDARDKTLLKRYLLEHPQKPAAERELLFRDEFDGDAVDPAKWGYDLGNWKLDKDGNYVTNGWGNNEQQFYTDQNASVENGVLTIAARKENHTDEKQGSYEYTSARMTTAQKFSVTGGRIEVRARCDSGKSLWPAIWMLPEEDAYGGWAASGEIDIMEGWGSKPDKICGTIHFGGSWPDNQYLTKEYQFPAGTSAEDWHVYAVEWNPDSISWYVDGQLYSTQTEWFSSGYSYPAPFNRNFYLILNLAVGGQFDGIDNVYADPQTFADGEKQFQIDYVRVYSPKEAFPEVRPGSPALELYTEGADASLKNSETGTEITVRSVGEKEYAVMGLLRNQAVAADGSYTLAFTAQSSVPREMIVTVEDSEYKRYFEKHFQLTDTPQEFSTEIQFPADMKADVKFQLGRIGEQIPSGTHTVKLTGFRFGSSAAG